MKDLSERALRELLVAADSGPVDALPSTLTAVLSVAGVRGAGLYIIDYDRARLEPAPGFATSRGRPHAQAVEDSLPGVAYREQRMADHIEADCHRVWVPVVERANALGVLELEVDSLDDGIRDMAPHLGIMVAYLLVTARAYTDVYERLRRRHDMSLAAEMHWDVLPATNYVGPTVAIHGDIEPAYEVGGDAFDYAFNNGVLNVSVFDAMGHGLEAALLSTQAVGAYRYARRRQQSVSDTTCTIDDALVRQFGGDSFVTGICAQLDTASGVFRWVNSGHVAPLLLRNGAVDSVLESTPSVPLGLELLDEPAMAQTTLGQGDRVLFYSDGVVEARSPQGDHFELDRLIDFVEKRCVGGRCVTVEQIIDEVMRHSAGPLRDDATVLMAELRTAP